MRFLWFIGLVSLVLACQDPLPLAEKAFPNACWDMGDTLSFRFETTADQAQPVLHLQLECLPDYRYQNLYLKLLYGPVGQPMQSLLVNDTLIDPLGNWLANISGGKVDFAYRPIGLEVDGPGVYQAALLHYMRDSSLCGIKSIQIQ